MKIGIALYKEKQVHKLLEDENIEIYVIGLLKDLERFPDFVSSPKEKAKKTAKMFARQSFGKAYFPKYSKKNLDEINTAIKEIIYELRSQYVIEYTSINQKRRHKNRNIEIKISNDSNKIRKGIYRKKIVVPQN